jgi:hypothetical protein
MCASHRLDNCHPVCRYCATHIDCKRDSHLVRELHIFCESDCEPGAHSHRLGQSDSVLTGRGLQRLGRSLWYVRMFSCRNVSPMFISLTGRLSPCRCRATHIDCVTLISSGSSTSSASPVLTARGSGDPSGTSTCSLVGPSLRCSSH